MGPKTVIRGGVGVYYMSPTQNGTTTGFAQTTNYSTRTDGITPSAGASLNGAYSLVNPFPTGILPARRRVSAGLTTNIGRGVSWDPARFKIPRTYQYSFGIQQQLPGAHRGRSFLRGQLPGVHQHGLQHERRYRGRIQTSPASIPRTTATQVPNPFFGVLPANGGQGQNATISRGSLLRPNPIFQDMTNNLAQWGRYRSDALQVKIERAPPG